MHTHNTFKHLGAKSSKSFDVFNGISSILMFCKEHRVRLPGCCKALIWKDESQFLQFYFWLIQIINISGLLVRSETIAFEREQRAWKTCVTSSSTSPRTYRLRWTWHPWRRGRRWWPCSRCGRWTPGSGEPGQPSRSGWRWCARYCAWNLFFNHRYWQHRSRYIGESFSIDTNGEFLFPECWIGKAE